MQTKQIFYNFLNEIKVLDGIGALLDWDQQVSMPEAGASFRSDTLEYVATKKHSIQTSAQFFDVAHQMLNESSSSEDDQINAKETIIKLEREKKLSPEFVARKAKLTSESFVQWSSAKKENNYKKVIPYLEQIFALSQEEASLVGYKEHLYDALLDVYEKDGKVSWVLPALEEIGSELSVVIPEFEKRDFSVDAKKFFMSKHDQARLCASIVEKLGINHTTYRLDASSHPFCTTIGVGDVRITTRYDEEDFLSALLSTLHEAGHALYELGLEPQWAGTPCGSSVSLGVHESQSRFIENIVGRSKPFSNFLSKVLKDEFKKDVSSDEIYKKLNHVKRSLIRVESDEVTYSLHVLIRTLCEISLLDGKVSVKDLPEYWSSLYKKYLGIEPKSDQEGVLQDVHWYSGAVGYFPTYVLGNVYSGMFRKTIYNEIPEADILIEKGEFQPIVQFLKKNIHVRGSRFTPRNLIESVTGGKISGAPFLEYIRGKN